MSHWAGLEGSRGTPWVGFSLQQVLSRSLINKEDDWQRGGVLATLIVPKLLLEGRTLFPSSETGTHPSTGHCVGTWYLLKQQCLRDPGSSVGVPCLGKLLIGEEIRVWGRPGKVKEAK